MVQINLIAYTLPNCTLMPRRRSASHPTFQPRPHSGYSVLLSRPRVASPGRAVTTNTRSPAKLLQKSPIIVHLRRIQGDDPPDRHQCVVVQTGLKLKLRQRVKLLDRFVDAPRLPVDR